jgi:hypothetical protein
MKTFFQFLEDIGQQPLTVSAALAQAPPEWKLALEKATRNGDFSLWLIYADFLEERGTDSSELRFFPQRVEALKQKIEQFADADGGQFQVMDIHPEDMKIALAGLHPWNMDIIEFSHYDPTTRLIYVPSHGDI